MKRILGIVLAAAMMLTVSSCGGPAASSNGAASEGAAAPTGEAAEITFATWGSEEEMQALVDLYNETQSEIHVTLQVTPLTEFGTLMNATLGTDEGPDVLWAGLQTRLWGDAGMLAELQDLVAQDNIDLSVFMEYPMKQNYVGDILYGIPMYTDSYAIAYNTAIFDKYGVEYPQEGWNWNDYEALAEELNGKIQAAGGSEIASALAINEPAHGTLLLLTNNGAQLYNDDVTACALNCPESVEMLEMVQRMIESGAQADYDTLVETAPVSLLMSGIAGMVIVCPDAGTTGLFEDSEVKDTLRYIAFPNGPTSGSNYLATVTMNNVVINKGTSNLEASWEFVKWLTTDQEAIEAYAEQEWHVPTNLNSIDAWAESHSDYAEVYVEEIDKIVTIWDVPLCNYSCLGQISPNLIPVFNGEMTPEEGLQNLEAAINELLAEELAEQQAS